MMMMQPQSHHQQQLPSSSSSAANKQYLTVNQVLQRARLNDPSHVRRMNVSGSALEDISVMAQFPAVEVCSFAVNDISDLEAFRGCSRLQELFLRKNRIADFSQVLHLSHLPLRAVGLAENPISTHPEYRKFVISALPQLLKLDDVEVTAAERQEAECNFPDPFTVAMEMGVAPLPAIAGRPSHTASQGTMNLSPPRPGTSTTKQQQGESSPYDAFAATYTSSSSSSSASALLHHNNNNNKPASALMSNNNNNNVNNNKLSMRQPEFFDSPAEVEALAATSPSLGVNGRTGGKNRYNGDDVPIGGGPVSTGTPRPATAISNTTHTTASRTAVINSNNNNRPSSAGAPSSASSSATANNTTSVSLAQKRAQMKAAASASKSNASSNNFLDQDINVAVPSKQQQQQHFGGMGRENNAHNNTMSNNSGSQSGFFSEDAAVQAVKVLLGSMTPDGLAQVRRYINAI